MPVYYHWYHIIAKVHEVTRSMHLFVGLMSTTLAPAGSKITERSVSTVAMRVASITITGSKISVNLVDSDNVGRWIVLSEKQYRHMLAGIGLGNTASLNRTVLMVKGSTASVSIEDRKSGDVYMNKNHNDENYDKLCVVETSHLALSIDSLSLSKNKETMLLEATMSDLLRERDVMVDSDDASDDLR